MDSFMLKPAKRLHQAEVSPDVFPRHILDVARMGEHSLGTGIAIPDGSQIVIHQGIQDADGQLAIPVCQLAVGVEF